MFKLWQCPARSSKNLLITEHCCYKSNAARVPKTETFTHFLQHFNFLHTLYVDMWHIYIYHIVFGRYANSFSYSSLPNKRGGGMSNCKFWGKKPSSSFNYYKRMRHKSVIPRSLVSRKTFCVGVKEIEKKLKWNVETYF